jgi:hypothetical protein
MTFSVLHTELTVKAVASFVQALAAEVLLGNVDGFYTCGRVLSITKR